MYSRLGRRGLVRWTRELIKQFNFSTNLLRSLRDISRVLKMAGGALSSSEYKGMERKRNGFDGDQDEIFEMVVKTRKGLLESSPPY